MHRLLPLSALLILALACSGRQADSASHMAIGAGSNRTVGTSVPVPANPPMAVTPPIQTSGGSGGANTSPISPDPQLTPGYALDVTKADICTPGYAKKVRAVPQAVKELAYREYGITSRQPHEYEVDHLISLELGGSNSIKNLWPESFVTEPWNAHVKDKLENKLHDMICTGQIDIKAAQREIATDWITAYKKYLGEPSGSQTSTTALSRQNLPQRKDRATDQLGAPKPASAASASTTSGAVVGNRKSHIYHRPGCPDYGKVSPANRVEFSSAAKAEKAGYRLAGNCPH